MKLIYDFDTSNESFIKVCKILKDEGIKNYYFPLILYDESLKGVRLYDSSNKSLEKTFSLETMARIQKEIRVNVWYYLREVVLIPETGGTTRYEANRANIALTFCLSHNLNVMELLPRQNGKTISSECFFTWVYHFSTINTSMVFSNKQYDDSKLNIKRFNDITDLLPKFLLGHLNSKYDTDNLAEIRCDSLNNTISALSTARDETSADKLGKLIPLPSINFFNCWKLLKLNKLQHNW